MRELDPWQNGEFTLGYRLARRLKRRNVTGPMLVTSTPPI